MSRLGGEASMTFIRVQRRGPPSTALATAMWDLVGRPEGDMLKIFIGVHRGWLPITTRAHRSETPHPKGPRRLN